MLQHTVINICNKIISMLQSILADFNDSHVPNVIFDFLYKTYCHVIYTGPNMFGGPTIGANPEMDMLSISLSQVGQGMQQQPLTDGK